MAKVVELTKALRAKRVADRPPPDYKLEKSSRQPHHPRHLEAKAGKNNLTLLEKEILLEKRQRKGGVSMTSAYKSKRIDLEDKGWEKKLE